MGLCHRVTFTFTIRYEGGFAASGLVCRVGNNLPTNPNFHFEFVRFRRRDIINYIFYLDCGKCLDFFFSVTTGCNPVDGYQCYGSSDACFVSVGCDVQDGGRSGY
jgi:hypothetical protein